ncbi:hypothetical protein SVIOM342S_03002 [Streptomyces violaceorubidus]
MCSPRDPVVIGAEGSFSSSSSSPSCRAAVRTASKSSPAGSRSKTRRSGRSSRPVRDSQRCRVSAAWSARYTRVAASSQTVWQTVPPSLPTSTRSIHSG